MFLLASLGFAVGLACSGESSPASPPGGLGDGPGAGPGPGADDTSDDPAEDPDDPVGGDACDAPRIGPRAVLLSDIQYVRSIQSLLGAGAVLDETVGDPAFKPFSQKGVVVNASLLRSRLDLGSEAAQSLAGRIVEVTGCATADDACAEAYLGPLAERAFRRPVAADELAALMDVYRSGLETDFDTGIQLAVEALIASPSFAYRTEFGNGTAEPGAALRLAPHELASLLSFWLTDAPPDAALAEAAASGALLGTAELQGQVERLLGSEVARDGVVHTLLSAWGMSNVFDAVKSPTLFPEFGPLLQSNMFEETRLFLHDALWSEGATLEGVVNSRSTFVNQALADLYGVPFPGTDPTSFVAVDLPADERAGLLTQASLLTARARTDNTSVVARGLFVRAAFLCLERPPPPPEAVIAALQALLAADLTERERAEYRAMTTPCNGCHATIDGFGLMLEGYDAIGRHRTELEGDPIDTSATLDSLGFPGTFSGAVEFADTLASTPQFTACVARHLAVYATGDDGITTSDCELSEFLELPPTEARLEDVITTLAASPLLQMRSGEEQ